jgi:signal transduction histidine kinase
VRFKYQLQGYDSDWVDAKERRVAYYTNTAPGDYIFRVMAANSDGVWSAQSAVLRIKVYPPFWRTWWFMALTVMGIVGIGFLMYRRRIGQLQKAHRAQEAFSRQLIDSQETERKRIAAELHDSLGQDLLIIKNRAVMGLKMLEDPAKVRDQIEQISGTASASINEVRQIAYNLRPYQLDEIGLTQALEELVERVSASSQIEFKVDIDPIDDLFAADAAINLYRIVQESLNNVVKHSAATQVEVAVRRETTELEIEIRDNGKGFSAASQNRDGFGLRGLSERSRILGGRLSIQSAAGEGTVIRVRVEI